MVNNVVRYIQDWNKNGECKSSEDNHLTLQVFSYAYSMGS